MKSFKEISISLIILLTIILILEFYYAEKKEKEIEELYSLLYKCEKNNITCYNNKLNEMIEKRKNFTTKKLAKSSIIGFIRGCITGALVNGVEGAATGGIVFAIINPIINACEYHI
jgi:uncharacterized protein (UPF0333 family)